MRILGFLLLILGIVAVITASKSYYEDFLLASGSQIIQGKIIDKNQGAYKKRGLFSKSNTTSYGLDVEYVVNGNIYSLKRRVGQHDFYRKNIGDAIEVRYAPSSPSIAELPGMEEGEEAYVTILIGGLFVFVGFLMSRRRRSRYS